MKNKEFKTKKNIKVSFIISLFIKIASPSPRGYNLQMIKIFVGINEISV